MTGHLYVTRQGRHVERQLGIHADSCLEGLSRLTELVHREGGRIFAELGHAGSQSSVADAIAIAPSAVPNPMTGRMPMAMSVAQIDETVVAFGAAALRAKQAGFDGLHIAGANGYLLSQFGSPYSNRRDDDWGGDALRRGRFVTAVFTAIRESVGRDFPFTARLGLVDAVSDGMSLEEGLDRLANLNKLGLIDAIEPALNVIYSYAANVRPYIGVGSVRALQDALVHRVFAPQPPPAEAYFEPLALAVKAKTKLPVILMGGIRSKAVMERLLQSGAADFLAMARPFIRQPTLVRDLEQGHDVVDCVSCNACIQHTGRYSLRCWRTPKWRLMHYFMIVFAARLAKLHSTLRGLMAARKGSPTRGVESR